MAELYENPKQYVTAGGAVGDSANGTPTFERMLADIPPEEREEAMKYITAPPSGEEIMRAMQEKNSRGEVMNMTLDQYRLFKAHNKSKEVDVIAGIGEAASTVFDEVFKAAGSMIDDPTGAVTKLTPSVVEAFAQGTRNMYGMAAQSADPNSVFFRMKNALQANGDDEEAELQQFMEAQAFNVHSMRLMTGQDTIIMDKDIINPEMTQVMSYIADPTLFVPFGGIAAKGATMIGMGEKLAMAGARTQAIRNMVLGGAIKWGVGAPLEFMGGAIRNTIDYGIERGSRAIETVSGVAAKDIQTTARLSGWGTASASVAGFEVNSALGDISKLYAGSSLARNVGEAASIYGEQMMKQGKIGRGVLGYAGQAIRDTERAGIKLSPQTKSLLKAIEAVDPLFVYADDIASGAAQGAIIGGGLGYLAGGEEGMAGGIGSGMALGAIGAGVGKVVSDVTGNTKIDQMAIQRKLIIEALKENGNENAIGFEAMAAMAEATGDRAFQGYIDGIIAGIDTVNPDAVFKAYNEVEYNMHLKSKGIDPNTGVLLEKSRIFPELVDRTVKADVLGILRDTGNRFAGDPAGFEQAIKNNPEFSKLKPVWSRLDDNAKQVILKQIKDNGDPAFVKGLRGRQLNAHWGDLAYSERLADMINTLNQKNSNSVPDKIREILKQETRRDKKLTRRGQMLKEKLQADGYIDKDGNIRQRRLADVEGTQGEFEASAGWAKTRDSTGRTEVVINLDKWAKDSGNRLSLAHELYHSIMLESVFAPDYIDRLSQKLLGKFDPKTGRVLEPALVPPDELMKFFGKYIENDPNNRRDAETIKRKKEELKKSIEEYRTRGTANRVADPTAIPLEHLVEEFGAYYFSKWVKAQPIDYMFRGGEMGGIRGLFEMASDGWLDYWKGKVGEKNPNFNFDAMGERGVSKAFERDGKRISSRSLDLFMRDIVRIEANRNSNNGFDVNKLSKESREWFLKVNGLRGAAFGQLDQQGNVKRPRLRRYTAEEIRQGKEMFKVLESLPPAAHKDGMRRDGDGNWSGQPNTAQINALVGAGYIQRAWFDRMTRAFDIVNGSGSNVIEFGYLGYSAHIGDGNERVYGAAVPFKNRRAVLIGVDFKVRADGTVFSNLHTLDLKVIEARGNEVWKDPQTRELWKGNRTDMEADFYAYLSNASLPSDHPNRKPSAKLLDKGDGLGGQRRDALHQMLGFHKGSDLPYINRPIAEIPVGIRHSVTTFSNDGIVNMRVDNKPRYDFNFENAHLDLSRNFMPDEMTQETTPSGGKIIKHATGYQISKQAGTKFKVFDPEGKHLGDFDTVADAGRAAQKHFNAAHEAKTEGKDPAVPRTEAPPSRQAYIEREFEKTAATYNNTFVGGKDNYVNNVKVLLDRLINGREDVGVGDGYIERAKKLRESIEKNGIIKLRDLEELSKLGAGIMHDTSRLPYYNYDFFWQITGDLLTENLKKAGERYDNMYPMEIKSALHGTLAQIFQDYPQITAKALIGKIQKYGSLNKARLMQEATEIGLIDLLKSKPTATKIKKDIYRAYDRATESFTGEVKVKETPVQYEPFVDIQEILDFAKSKEIRVTIEEGAREVNNMDTSKLTLGGDKDNYKQTAIRINPEYAHGVKGHYGEDTIVHFRTTERVDSEGNRVLFIEEVQANNPYNTENPQVAEFKKKKTELESAIVLKEELIKRGLFVLDENGKYQRAKDLLVDNLEHRKNVLEAIANVTGSKSKGNGKIDRLIFQEIEEAVATGLTQWGRDEIIGRIDDLLSDEGTYDIWRQLKTDKAILDWVDASAEINKKLNEYRKDMESHYDASRLEYSNVEFPENLVAIVADRQAVVDRLQRAIEGDGKRFPMTDVKDWSLTALKGIIRQAIRDGLDKITLTHPDDSPTKSYMKITARRPLYGKIIPDLWNSWLKQYGIEIKQSNKLADAGVEKRRAMMLKVTDKIHDANKLILERFEQVGNREDFSVIQRLTELLVAPVQDAPEAVHREVKQLALSKINDQELSTLIFEVAKLRSKEREHYEAIETIRAEGLRGLENNKTTTFGSQISEEAIDRGMTFELNDRIKREFLEGRINTHSMPSEDGATQGGRTYTQEEFKSKFIGKVAAEDPDLTEGLRIEATNNDLKLIDQKGNIIGHINSWHDAQDMIAKSGEAEIIPSYRGMGYGKLLYSEFMERLRAQGKSEFRGTIADPLNRPVKIRESIAGNTKFEVYDTVTNTYKYLNAGDGRLSQPRYESTGRVSNALDPKAHYQPSEDIYSGGRVYDQNSKQFKSGFVGLYAAENPDRVKGISLQFMKRADGSHRIRLTDNSKKGESADIGHITANISGKTATLSTHINKEYRGRKLAYVVYSEMAERLRSMGIESVDGQIVNPDGVPVHVREQIIGDTRDYNSGKPIDINEAARRIKARQEEVGSMGGVDVVNKLYKQGRYQPAEGEQGGRTYTPKQMEREFIGRIAAKNPEKIKGLKIAYGIVHGRMGEEAVVLMKDGKNIGRISWMTDKEYTDRPANDISVEIEPSYRGRGLQDVLYSEAYERMRANGTTMTRQDIYNTKGLPVRSQIKILGKNASTFNTGFVDKKLTYAAFMREMKHALASGEEFVSTEGKLDPKAWYMPAEDINTVVTGNLNDILRTTGGAYHTHNITGLIEQYIHRFKGGDIGEISRYVELKEEHNRLDRALSESEDYYNSLSEEESRNPPDDAPNLPEDIRDEMSPIMDEMNDLENSISTSVEDNRSTSFSDLVTLYEQANELQKHAEKVRQSSKGFQYWDSFKRRFLKSENEEVFAGVERVLRDNEASKLPKLFVSELYSRGSYDPQGLIVDILQKEGKLNKNLDPIGEINPQRLINLLRNKAGSGNKAFTEAQAIGFVDWLKLRMGGVDKDTAGGLNLAQPLWALKSIEDATQHRESLNLKGKQNTIPTREVMEWLRNNQLNVTIDKKPVANVESSRYVAGGETEGYRDLVIRMPERYSHGVEGHFGAGKTNVVAHVRVTFRRDAEGKRVMHIEEIQANNANVDVLPPKERETYKQVLKELAQAQLNFETKATLNATVGYFNLKTKADKEAVGAVTAKSIEEGKPYGGNPVEDARKLVNREKKRIEDDFQDKSRWANLSFKKFEEYVNADFQKKYPDVTNYLRLIYNRQMAEAEWRLEAKKSLEKTKLWNNEPEQLSDVDPKTGIKYPAMSEIGRLRSEIQSAAEKEGNKAPLQDPKEWIKLAFRTILREATVEGVDRVTITPYDKTPMQVGMNKDSAKSLYEKIIPQYFESELAKVNQKLDIKNKNNNLAEQRLSKEYIDLKDVTQKRIKDVSDGWDRSQPTHPDTAEVFRFLHEEDSTLLKKNATLRDGEFNRMKFGNYKDKISALAEGLPSGSNRNLVVRAVNAKFQQMNHYANWKLSDYAKIDAFGESASLVDRSIGFDMTEKTKELGKKSRPNFMPAEYTEFKSEQSPLGRIMRNAKGYVITMANNKFRVYNPAKAILGVYGSEEEAKKRIYREIPKQ